MYFKWLLDTEVGSQAQDFLDPQFPWTFNWWPYQNNVIFYTIKNYRQNNENVNKNVFTKIHFVKLTFSVYSW
jgi:hypothetical protein